MSIRVLVVEDSPVALAILKKILSSSPDIEIVGTARTGLEGLHLIPDTRPDVICTDFFMPHMNGLEFTSQVMLRYPLPILVVSASVQEEEDTHRIFQLLEAGAVDILPKPKAGLDSDNIRLKQALIDKIKILSGVKVFKKKQQKSKPNQALIRHNQIASSIKLSSRPKILAVGSSTGGPLALQQILTSLPTDFPLPIVCVQHISLGFLQGLIDWLDESCHLSIQIAPAGERPKPGNIYFPPERQHLEIDHQGRFIHSKSPLVNGHCPSVTTLFKSIAQFYGRRAIGILLTGMGCDGADGMKAITDAGGLTIAQDEATSIVFGMPKEAIALGAAQQVLPIQAIGPTVLRVVQQFSLELQ
ncbi:chemotaxis response regulator containing a CheY-like receiver domain and a methylesterase domain [Leptolyngbya sp. PCC 7375]|nr:chemotaxis response regulator containing a CheY-like receiver domain and a methylesterase domain [Leptolyngbya sp. PCC 7375]